MVPIFYYVFNIPNWVERKNKNHQKIGSLSNNHAKKAGSKVKLPFMFSDTNFPRLDCFELSSATFIFILVKIVVGLSGGGETLFWPFLFPALVVGRDGNFGSVNIQNSGLGVR